MVGREPDAVHRGGQGFSHRSGEGESELQGDEGRSLFEEFSEALLLSEVRNHVFLSGWQLFCGFGLSGWIGCVWLLSLRNGPPARRL